MLEAFRSLTVSCPILFQCAQAHEQHRCLGAVGAGFGAERIIADAPEQLCMDRPAHGLQGPGGDPLRIQEHAQPIYYAFMAVTEGLDYKPRVIHLTPQGRVFDQQAAKELAIEKGLVFLCGHYEGIDERVLDEIVTDQVSIGDFVLTGGELPAMMVVDAVSRLIPGVLHNEDSPETDSFMNGLLEYPQYSRPPVWHGREVPQILLSGDHAKVDQWRLAQSLERTRIRRPELYEAYRKEHPPVSPKKRRKREQ